MKLNGKTIVTALAMLCLFKMGHTQNGKPEFDLSPEIVQPGRLDSSKLDWGFLEGDVKVMAGESRSEWKEFPLEILPFPVVTYKYGATGAGDFFIEEPFKITATFFLIGKHTYNWDEFKESETHRAFFNLLVLTDTIDTLDYSVVNSYVTSRNHPDYVGEGRIITKHLNVDYVTFHRPDHTSYAIIGTKLFDLQLGQTIIVAPQKDGSVRFLQLDTQRLLLNEVEPFMNALIKKDPVKGFLSADGNI